MAKHKKTHPPAPPGLKMFALILAAMVASLWTFLGMKSALNDQQEDREFKETVKEAVTERATPAPPPKPSASPSPTQTFFATCEEAKEAGALPLKKGHPGYLAQFDGDGDGTACEGVK